MTTQATQTIKLGFLIDVKFARRFAFKEPICIEEYLYRFKNDTVGLIAPGTDIHGARGRSSNFTKANIARATNGEGQPGHQAARLYF